LWRVGDRVRVLSPNAESTLNLLAAMGGFSVHSNLPGHPARIPCFSRYCSRRTAASCGDVFVASKVNSGCSGNLYANVQRESGDKHANDGCEDAKRHDQDDRPRQPPTCAFRRQHEIDQHLALSQNQQSHIIRASQGAVGKSLESDGPPRDRIFGV